MMVRIGKCAYRFADFICKYRKVCYCRNALQVIEGELVAAAVPRPGKWKPSASSYISVRGFVGFAQSNHARSLSNARENPGIGGTFSAIHWNYLRRHISRVGSRNRHYADYVAVAPGIWRAAIDRDPR